jgi:hypothetical protein
VRNDTHLVDELTAMNIVRNKNLSPKFRSATLDQIPSLLLKHRVVIRNRDEFVVAESLSIRNVCQVWVSCFTESPDNQGLVQLLRKEYK